MKKHKKVLTKFVDVTTLFTTAGIIAPVVVSIPAFDTSARSTEFSETHKTISTTSSAVKMPPETSQVNQVWGDTYRNKK